MEPSPDPQPPPAPPDVAPRRVPITIRITPAPAPKTESLQIPELPKTEIFSAQPIPKTEVFPAQPLPKTQFVQSVALPRTEIVESPIPPQDTTSEDGTAIRRVSTTRIIERIDNKIEKLYPIDAPWLKTGPDAPEMSPEESSETKRFRKALLSKPTPKLQGGGTVVRRASDVDFRSAPRVASNTVVEAKPVPKPRFALIITGFLFAIALTIFGIRYFVSKEFNPPSTPADASNSAISDTINASAAGLLTTESLQTALESQIRPKDWLDRFSASTGAKPAFTDISKLNLKPSQPAKLFILLTSPLDKESEERWKKSGMLLGEPPAGRPFIRTVIVKDQDALDNLDDWRIEAVALTPAATNKK